MKSNLIKYSTLCLFALLQIAKISGQEINWDKIIEEWRIAYNVPGMSVGIIKDGKIILSKGYGSIEEGKREKVDQHTLFSIASNTKAFISAAIATLVEEGKLGWDD